MINKVAIVWMKLNSTDKRRMSMKEEARHSSKERIQMALLQTDLVIEEQKAQ